MSVWLKILRFYFSLWIQKKTGFIVSRAADLLALNVKSISLRNRPWIIFKKRNNLMATAKLSGRCDSQLVESCHRACIKKF